MTIEVPLLHLHFTVYIPYLGGLPPVERAIFMT